MKKKEYVTNQARDILAGELRKDLLQFFIKTGNSFIILAKESGISVPTLYSFFNNRKVLRMSTICKLREFLKSKK